MLNRAQTLIAVVAMMATTAVAAAKIHAPKPASKPPRCDVKIHQPAASVVLNRTTAPPSICVKGCDARLVGARKEADQIAALAIYSGRRCLPADSSKNQPTNPETHANPPSKPAPKAKSRAKPLQQPRSATMETADGSGKVPKPVPRSSNDPRPAAGAAKPTSPAAAAPASTSRVPAALRPAAPRSPVEKQPVPQPASTPAPASGTRPPRNIAAAGSDAAVAPAVRRTTAAVQR